MEDGQVWGRDKERKIDRYGVGTAGGWTGM